MSEENKHRQSEVSVSETMSVKRSVRLGCEMDKTIDELAKKAGVKWSDIVRLALADRLETYLGTLRYVDEEQGALVLANVTKIGNLMDEILMELRRIGVNYNQEIKLRNIAKKEGKDVDSMRGELMSRQGLDADKIEMLLAGFDKSADKVGAALWRTLM